MLDKSKMYRSARNSQRTNDLTSFVTRKTCIAGHDLAIYGYRHLWNNGAMKCRICESESNRKASIQGTKARWGSK